MQKLNAENLPNLLDRLAAHFGNWYRLTEALGVNRNYSTQWTREGFIPEIWALEVEHLNLGDQWGEISAYDVLIEARAGRSARFERDVSIHARR